MSAYPAFAMETTAEVTDIGADGHVVRVPYTDVGGGRVAVYHVDLDRRAWLRTDGDMPTGDLGPIIPDIAIAAAMHARGTVDRVPIVVTWVGPGRHDCNLKP